MRKSLLLLLLLLSFKTWAQNIQDAWVFFTDKPHSATYLSFPNLMLSHRSITRRFQQGISVDEKDVPVEQTYIHQIVESEGITYQAKSKWMNAIHIQGVQQDIENLLNFDFVDHIEFANKNIGVISRPAPLIKPVELSVETKDNFDYGYAYNQIHMLNGEVMHQNGFTGEGVLLAVIDAGFLDVDGATMFQHLFDNNKVKDVYNFVSHDEDVYQFSMHGSGVLSTIAAKTNGELVGTAPDVEVALYVSEDVMHEMPIEESYWVEAAERADSLGVNVINTSLGYRTYDVEEYSYTMDDLDGNTSFISRAANIAVSRGIVVVVSAGNSGDTNDWPKIGMPGDAQNVITVGALDENGIKTGFSSIGPTADGRIKPDVMAQGSNVSAYWYGSIQGVGGTSFSSPITAGMVACMVQAFPHKTPAQIKQDLINISDRHLNPDNEYGNGIPDFSLYNTTSVAQNIPAVSFAYPNPAHDFIYLPEEAKCQIFTMDGKQVLSAETRRNKVDISRLEKGVYFLSTDNKTYKIIKE